MNIPETNQKRIVIVGAGFAGIAFAKKLKGIDAQIIMIDRHNYHTFQPLLYQVSTSGLEPDSIAYPIRKILKELKSFYFKMARVINIDLKSSEINTSIGKLKYDYLVLATGTKVNFFGNEELEEYSMPMKTVPQALNIRSLMLQNFEKADNISNEEERSPLLTFCVAGGGPTGVELAGALAELKRNVFPRDYKNLDVTQMEIHLFEGKDRVLETMSKTASDSAEKFLKELGVQVHTDVFVESYDGNTIQLSDKREIKTKNMIWAAGVTGALVEGIDSKMYEERQNRYKVDEFNKIDGLERVYAIGDIALMKSDAYPNGHPQVAQPAIQQGKHLAKNFKRHFKGLPMKPFTYNDKGTMATIGRNRAVADIGKLHFGGFFAWFIWTFVHLMALVGFRNRVIVFFNWVYNYINYDRAARLIIRPFTSNK